MPTVALPPTTLFTLHVTAGLAVPDTVAVNACVAPVFSEAVVGETATTTGTTTGAVTARFTAELVVPPMPGFATVIFTVVPARAAARVPVARSRVADTNVVVSGAPLSRATELAVKLEPLSESSKLPAGTVAGARLQTFTAGCVIVSDTAAH